MKLVQMAYLSGERTALVDYRTMVLTARTERSDRATADQYFPAKYRLKQAWLMRDSFNTAENSVEDRKTPTITNWKDTYTSSVYIKILLNS